MGDASKCSVAQPPRSKDHNRALRRFEMSFNKECKTAYRLFGLGFIAVGLLAITFTGTGRAQSQKSEGETEIRVSRNSDGETIEVKARNVELTKDGSDVKRIAKDGYLYIDTERSGVKRHLKMVQSADGKLQRTFSVNGQASPFDAEAQEWLSKILVEFLHQPERSSERVVRP
jgi:hypothetical protein